MKEVMTGFRTAFPDLRITIDNEIYAENSAVIRWTFSGTNTGSGDMPPTGKSVDVWGISIFHFANGKLTKEIVAYNNQSFMEQLGFTMMPAEKK
jgi:predicted ester cyclase